MNNSALFFLQKLAVEHALPLAGYETLIRACSPGLAKLAARHAVALRQKIYGRAVYIRGLLEISNFCKNNCLYCGIRSGNTQCERFRLSDRQILACCAEGYALGFRTFVLQGGEDAELTDERIAALVRSIKAAHPDCAVTLSLGEKSAASYRALFAAGAERYLLRHETANSRHYAQLHPPKMSFTGRMRCLRVLHEIGYQTGCGFMAGSPWQTPETLAEDLKFIETFQPEMCGIGPFVPHHATPFHCQPPGTLEMTCYLLSLTRLIVPCVLLPATTALSAIHPEGREKGILAGANVLMPNLSPETTRAKYELYDHKPHSGAESAQAIAELSARMRAIGYEIVCDRGDVKKAPRPEM